MPSAEPNMCPLQTVCAFAYLAKTEGILPVLESAHIVIFLMAYMKTAAIFILLQDGSCGGFVFSERCTICEENRWGIQREG